MNQDSQMETETNATT